MSKVSVNWTIDLDLAVEINRRAEESNKKMSFVANNLLREILNSKNPLKTCEVCGKQYSKILDFCPYCANKKNDEELEKVNKTLEEKDKQKEQEKRYERIKDLNIRLKKRKEILEYYRNKKDKEGIKLSKEQIKEIKSEIKNISI